MDETIFYHRLLNRGAERRVAFWFHGLGVITRRNIVWIGLILGVHVANELLKKVYYNWLSESINNFSKFSIISFIFKLTLDYHIIQGGMKENPNIINYKNVINCQSLWDSLEFYSLKVINLCMKIFETLIHHFSYFFLAKMKIPLQVYHAGNDTHKKLFSLKNNYQ